MFGVNYFALGTIQMVEDSFIKNVGVYYREKIRYDASFYVAEIADGIMEEYF